MTPARDTDGTQCGTAAESAATNTSPSAGPTLAWLPAVRQPALCLGWDAAQWQLAIRLARRTRLLARLAHGIADAGLMDAVPAPAARQLRAEMNYSRWRTTALTWALERLSVTLAEAPYPRVLLKGAAYIGQELPIARGRLPSDIDILVPQAHVDDAQRRLHTVGWFSAEMDEHDQRYYREWSHEVPPMQHPAFGLELDLHHNILPPLARVHVDAAPLLQRLQPSRLPGWQVLHPLDQVLHSAAHLFQDAEPRERVRDLVDLDGLMVHFGGDLDFWDELPQRALALGLADPLALACHFCSAWLGTPIPAAARQRIRANGPGGLRRAALVALFDTVLRPADPDGLAPRTQDAAAQLVLARYHLGRLPLRLLLPHLWHKARKRRRRAASDPPQPDRA